jgi:hypothetical protein
MADDRGWPDPLEPWAGAITLRQIAGQPPMLGTRNVDSDHGPTSCSTLDMSDAPNGSTTPDRPRYYRRLFEKTSMAFYHACNQSDLKVANACSPAWRP